MSILSNLKPPPGAKQGRLRVGRGTGSGVGKTAGRGQKGQKARCGHGKPAFEGGQTPMARRLPKLGFRNIWAAKIANINVSDLEVFEAGSVVTIEALREKRLVRGQFDGVKVLGDGDLGKVLTVKAHGFSASARAKIEQAGGTVHVLTAPSAQS